MNSAGPQVPAAEGGGGGGSIGLNFAIPIDFARSIASQVIQTGRVTHTNIGVLGVAVTAEIAQATRLPRGALVEQVLVALRGPEVTNTVEVDYTRNGSSRSVNVAVSVT